MKQSLVSLVIICLASGLCHFSLGQQALEPVVVVHGGAGNVAEENYEAKYEGTKEAVRRAFAVLTQEGGSAMDAVVEAIKVMEDLPAFNAGKGSALTMAGTVEMDASIMDGVTMEAGSVAVLSSIKNPIEAARAVLESTPHVQLAGQGATDFAIDMGLTTEDDDYFVTDEKFLEWLDWLDDHGLREPPEGERVHVGAYPRALRNADHWAQQRGTVGAVVMDAEGNIVAGTSTGGLTGKMPGRVGDTPGVGHGVFADVFSAGVSCTGVGEVFMKAGVARRVASNVGFGQPAALAIEEALSYMTDRVGGDGGVITIAADTGEVAVGWNSAQMAWAYAKNGLLYYGLNVGEVFEEDL